MISFTTVKYPTATRCLIATLVMACHPATSAERSLITTRAERQDCASIVANDSGAEAYAAYAGCVLNNSYGAFYALYTRHLRAFPDEKQDADVKFKVGPHGKVTSVVASGRGVTDSDFLRKLEARLKVIEFVPPKDAEHEITYTFRFTQVRED